MKIVFILLVVIFSVLQYKLWFGNENISQVKALKKEVEAQQQKNQQLEKENLAAEAEIDDLKKGNDAVEERAREELGMLKRDEVYFQFVN